MIKFNDKDEFGLGANYPYISIELILEQAEEVKGKRIELYDIEGRSVFDIKDKDGNILNNKMMFICFK